MYEDTTRRHHDWQHPGCHQGGRIRRSHKKATEVTQTDECAAVTTRAQAKCDKQNIKPLKVTKSEIPDLTPQKLQEAQKGDKSLGKLFESAKQNTMYKTKGRASTTLKKEEEYFTASTKADPAVW